MKKLLYQSLFVLSLLLPGCFSEIQTEREFTINPNGSGKVNITGIFHPAFNLSGNNYEKEARDMAYEIIKDSNGIEIWDKVYYGPSDTNNIEFKGTAYFPDLSEVRLNIGLLSQLLNFTFLKSVNGQVTITLADITNEKRDKVSTKKLSKDEINKAIDEKIREYNESRKEAEDISKEFWIKTTFHLPGEIKKVSNFKKIAPATVTLHIFGEEMLQRMDKMMSDREFVKQLVLNNEDIINDQHILNELLFGQKKPVFVTFSKESKPLFDYQKEVEQAKKGYQTLLNSLSADYQPAEDKHRAVKDALVKQKIIEYQRTDDSNKAAEK
jgi:hypothetical protein